MSFGQTLKRNVVRYIFEKKLEIVEMKKYRLLPVISDGNFKRIIKMVKIDYKRIKRLLDEIFFLIIEL